MTFFLNQTTNLLTRAIGQTAAVGTASVKAGDTLLLDVTFHDGTAEVDLAAGYQLAFAIKASRAAGAASYALVTVWTRVAVGRYQARISLNTGPLIAAIGDGIQLLAVGEFSWSEGNGWESSNTLTVTIENDVIKGTETPPQILA